MRFLYSLKIDEVPKPAPGPNEVLVRMTAVALNHRDLFIRQSLYPAISFDAPMLADGCGIVIAVGSGVKRTDLLNKKVLLAPMRGWESDPAAPENAKRFSVAGSSKIAEDSGTARDYFAVSEDEVVLAPPHLSDAEGAALPLAGLTGWRALVTKAGVSSGGKNVFLTGIGGGVALQVLQFAVAMGCNVYVSSGDQGKIDKAVAMGAKGGVNYKGENWVADLQAMLPKDRPYIDAIVDGAAGPIMAKAVKFVKPGGVIAQYGMTVGPKMDWLMQAVLANIDLKGSTMGSKQEFRDMVDFVAKHKIVPVVSRTVKGLGNLEGIDTLFNDMAKGAQFGKLVIEIDDTSSPKL